MSAINYSLTLTASGFMATLGAGKAALKGFQSVGAGAFSAVRGAASKLSDTLFRLPDQVTAVRGILSQLSMPVKLAADAETTAIALKVLTGSADKARELLSQIKKLGAETPFEFPELASSTQLLLAFGESQDRVLETLRRIGDVASLAQMGVKELAEIYGKARVQGTLFAEDINQLQGRGINVTREFAAILGVGKEEIKQMASEGKITFDLLEQAFINLTSAGGDAFGMMAAQSRTLNGIWSTFTDTVKSVAGELATPMLEPLKQALSEANSWTESLIPKAKAAGQELALWADYIRAAVTDGSLGELLAANLKAPAAEFANWLAGAIQAAVETGAGKASSVWKKMQVGAKSVEAWLTNADKIEGRRQALIDEADAAEKAGSFSDNLKRIQEGGGPLGDVVEEQRRILNNLQQRLEPKVTQIQTGREQASATADAEKARAEASIMYDRPIGPMPQPGGVIMYDKPIGPEPAKPGAAVQAPGVSRVTLPMPAMPAAAADGAAQSGRAGGRLAMLQRQFARQAGSGQGAVGWNTFLDRQAGLTDAQKRFALKQGPGDAVKAAGERMGSNRGRASREEAKQEKKQEAAEKQQTARDVAFRLLVKDVGEIKKLIAEQEGI